MQKGPGDRTYVCMSIRSVEDGGAVETGYVHKLAIEKTRTDGEMGMSGIFRTLRDPETRPKLQITHLYNNTLDFH